MEVEKAAKFVAWVDKEVLCPKYNGSALNDRINKIIRKTRRETLTNVITPSYDVKFLQPVIFSTSQVKSDESQDVLLAYVCIGTSAAPYSLPLYYFEHKPSNGIPKAFNLVDGELAANNPGTCPQPFISFAPATEHRYEREHRSIITASYMYKDSIA
ncbi:hypothetical protein ACFX2I_025187 [Malus domestica]